MTQALPALYSRMVGLQRLALQGQPAKQLRITCDDDGGQAHRNGTDAHGDIQSQVDENTSSDWDSDKVISRRPNEILDHLSVRSTG